MCISLVDFIQIGTLAGTFITALVTYLTVQEMKKQRQITYHPDLILDSSVAYSYARVKGDLGIPVEWSYEDKGNHYKPSDGAGQDSSFLKLHNIGLGAAKNIFAEYSFDFEKMFKHFEKGNNLLDEDLRFELLINGKSLQIKPKSDRLPFGESMFMNIEKDSHKIDHVLPDNISEDYVRLRFSNFYLKFISLNIYQLGAQFLQLRRNSGDKKIIALDPEDLPPLTLKLSYLDIANSQHEKNFEINYESWNFSNSDGTGQFVITEVKK